MALLASCFGFVLCCSCCVAGKFLIPFFSRNKQLFDHFPQGKARGSEFPAISREAFNRTICGVQLLNGTLNARDGRCFGKKKSAIHQVHGFFHVTNLDFYRSDPVMKWNRALIGNNKFSRLFDDQIGVTIPAAALAPERSWDMKSLGIYPRVFRECAMN